MYKLVFLLKKNSNLSKKQFIKRYDRVHRLLGEKHVPTAVHYTRRFLEPIQGIFTDADSAFDVITELWFNNEDEMKEALSYLRKPEIAAEIAADEELQFDRSSTQVYAIHEEYTSPRA